MLRRGGARSLTPELRSWVAAVPVKPPTPWLTAADNFIRDMKAASLWDIHDGINAFWAPNQATALVDLKVPSRVLTLAPSFSGVFTANQGFMGTGLSSGTQTDYIDTGFTPSGNMALNSASISIYVGNNTANNNIDIGANGVNDIFIQTRDATNNANVRFNNNTTTALAAGTVTDSIGLWTYSRTAADLTTGYKNGSSIGSSAQASVALPGVSIRYLQVPAGNSTTKQIRFGLFGAGLNATQAAALNFIVTRFGRAVGAIA